MDKKDIFITQKLKQDRYISPQANEIFNNFERGIEMDNNNEKKVIKISLKQFIAIAASLVILLFLGTNIYAHAKGLPNIFTAIENLFNTNTKKYEESEQEINLVAESNGVKLTLKTLAMDDNVLIVKYEAEGDKLGNQFYTWNDFDSNIQDVVAVLKFNNDNGKFDPNLDYNSDGEINNKDITTRLKSAINSVDTMSDLSNTFKQVLLTYMSEKFFNAHFTKSFVESNNYLYYLAGFGATGGDFEISDIALQSEDNGTYTYTAKIVIYDCESSFTNSINFTIINEDNKYVLDSYEYIGEFIY